MSHARPGTPPNSLCDSLPNSMPMLGRGKHRDVSRGACFMEYTSVLAGEKFTDSPQCVDTELATVLRGANDMLSDDERQALVPLLGRAIGLVVRRPDGRAAGRLLRLRARPEDEDAAVLLGRLRRSVSDRLISGIELDPADDTRWSWYRRHARVSRLFWDLLSEPDGVVETTQYGDRLVPRLTLLHECYEASMDELGLPRAVQSPVEHALPAGQPVQR